MCKRRLDMARDKKGQYERHSQKRKKISSNKFKGKKRWIVLAIIAILAVLIGCFGSDLIGFSHRIYESTKSNKLRDADETLQNGEPISILLTGIDNGALYYKDVEDGRTDVMMVITINPEDDSAMITSIPRDTLGPIGTSDDFDKLNHAYMNFGIDATIDSLQRYLDIPIDYHVTVNMQGFIDIIDNLGGIEITSNQSFTQNDVTFKEGETRTLSGVEAMQYVRMRKADEEGDLGREKRQQQLVEAVIKEVSSLETITNYNEILDTLGDNVKTDFKIDDMLTLQQNYLEPLQNLEKVTMNEYEDLNLDFGYYLYIPEEERIRVSNAIRASLGLDESETVIVYPAEYYTPEEYFSITDTNGNLIIDSDDLPVEPGVYTKSELNKLLLKVENNAEQSESEQDSESLIPEPSIEQPSVPVQPIAPESTIPSDSMDTQQENISETQSLGEPSYETYESEDNTGAI